MSQRLLAQLGALTGLLVPAGRRLPVDWQPRDRHRGVTFEHQVSIRVVLRAKRCER